MFPVLVMFFIETNPVVLDGGYKGGTSEFDILEFGILLARKFSKYFLVIYI